MNEIGIETARRQLGEIADRARFTGQPTLLTRKDRPAAVVVNVDWYELALSFIGVGDAAKLSAFIEELADATPDQHRELAEAIRQAAAVITGTAEAGQ